MIRTIFDQITKVISIAAFILVLFIATYYQDI